MRTSSTRRSSRPRLCATGSWSPTNPLAYPSGPKAEHFQATYNIEYDAHTYRIKYISSYGLDENIGCPSAQDRASSTCAHRNVNNWQIKLGRDIARVLDQRAAPSAVK